MDLGNMAKLLQLAEFISRIFPFLIVFACIFMYGIMDLIALVLIPLVIWLLWAKINDQKWDIPNRNQRVIPLIIVVIYGFLILAFRQDFPIKFYLVNVVFLLIITRFWKISIHCYGLSAIIIALIKSNNVLNGNPLYFIVPIYFLFLIATIWSRLYLKKHTLLQVVLGTFFGFFDKFVVCLIFNYSHSINLGTMVLKKSN